MSRHGADPAMYEFLERKAEEIKRRLDTGDYVTRIDDEVLNAVLADGDSVAELDLCGDFRTLLMHTLDDGDPRTRLIHTLVQSLRRMSRRHPGVEKRKLLEQCVREHDQMGNQIHERIRQRLRKQVGESLDERLRAFRSGLHDTPPSEVRTGADTVATTLECPVCFEHAPAVACVPCGHVTCHACHESWSSLNDACAVCRTRVERYIVLYM